MSGHQAQGAPVGHDVDRGTPLGSGGGYLNPAAPPRLLVVLPQLPFSERIKVGGQNTPSTAAECVARALVRLTPQVRVHLAAHQDAQVVLMPTATSDLRSHAVLTTPVGVPCGTHFFFLLP